MNDPCRRGFHDAECESCRRALRFEITTSSASGATTVGLPKRPPTNPDKTTELSSIGQRFLDEGADANAKEASARIGRQLQIGLTVAAIMLFASSVFGDTLLHEAAISGRAAECERQIDANAELEAKGRDGRTPLHEAAKYGHVECTKLLLAAGANPNAEDDNGAAPLHYAAAYGWTPPYFSELYGHAAAAQELIDAGADVNTKDDNGTAPLHMAGLHAHAAFAKLLLENGADPNAAGYGGWTPLHYAAAWYGDEATVKVLIDGGADLNAKNDDGHTPLHYAVQEGHEAVAELLRSHGGRAGEARAETHAFRQFALGDKPLRGGCSTRARTRTPKIPRDQRRCTRGSGRPRSRCGAASQLRRTLKESRRVKTQSPASRRNRPLRARISNWRNPRSGADTAALAGRLDRRPNTSWETTVQHCHAAIEDPWPLADERGPAAPVRARIKHCQPMEFSPRIAFLNRLPETK